MGGIQPAGNADNHGLALGRLETAPQPLDLDVERLIAILVEVAFAVRHVRKTAQRADQPSILIVRLMGEGHPAKLWRAVPCGVMKTTRPHPL